MTYYVYHIPVSQTAHASIERQKLVGEYSLIVAAKGSARRFIGKGRKECVITSRPFEKSSDILYWVQYQDGKKYWKDPKIADENTGWVFIPFNAKGTTEVQDYQGRVKYRNKSKMGIVSKKR